MRAGSGLLRTGLTSLRTARGFSSEKDAEIVKHASFFISDYVCPNRLEAHLEKRLLKESLSFGQFQVLSSNLIEKTKPFLSENNHESLVEILGG